MLNSLKKLMDNVPEDCVLVFDGLDGERALATHAGKVGKVFHTETTIDRADATRWVMTKFVALGKTISEEDARLLVQSSGYDQSVKGLGADQLRIAVQKIATFVGKRRKQIQSDDIIINSLATEEFNQWRIFDAMDAKDFVACQNCLQQFIDNEGGPQRAAEKLYGISLSRYRMLFFMKEGLAKKMSKADVAKETLALQKTMKSDTTGLEERVPAYTENGVNAALNGFYGRPPTVDQYTRKELVRIVQCLQEGLAEVRLRGNSPSVLLLADALFLACCTNVEDELLTRLRKSDD
jgi:hypothetical protein